MQCQLILPTPTDSIFLCADFQQSLGEAWNLKCQFLIPSQSPLEPQLQIVIKHLSEKGQIKLGYTHEWTLNHYDKNRSILSILAKPYPMDWTQKEWAVYPLSGNIKQLWDTGINHHAQLKWPASIPFASQEQWLQLEEERWSFLNRVLNANQCWWEQPFSKNGNEWVIQNASVQPESCTQHSSIPLDAIRQNHRGEWYVTTLGQGLSCGDAVSTSLNGTPQILRITKIHQSIDQTGAILSHSAAKPLKSHLTLMPWDQFPTLCVKPLSRPPAITGYIAIPKKETDLNPVQEDGRYPIRLWFESSNTPPWGRIARIQPLAGAQSAMHFPLQAGTAVWLGFLPHLPDQPFILGAMETAQQPSPVTQKNANDYVIQTRKGQRFRLADTPQAEGIFEFQGKQGFTFRIQEETGDISLETPQGENRLELSRDKQQVSIQCGPSLSLSLNAENSLMTLCIQDGPMIQMQTLGEQILIEQPECGTLSMQKGHGITLSSKEIITIKAPHVECLAENELKLQGHQSSICLNPSGIQMKTHQTIHMEAEQKILLSTAADHFVQAKNIHCTSQSQLKLQSVHIGIQADAQITQKASLITLN